MTDTISHQRRHEIMSSIKSKNTKPEVFFRKGLFRKGYRYSLHTSKIEGHPDLFLKKYNTAIFINGCFWHRHFGCKYSYVPKSNVEFWKKKFKDNEDRDRFVKAKLQEQGIKCLIIWECRIKQMKKSAEYRETVYTKVIHFLFSSEGYLEI